MPKFLITTIVIMLAITILSVITGNDFISNSVEATYSFQSLNGTISELEIEGSMNLSTLQDAILWISVIGGIAIVSGIAVLGSGLNEQATRWITYMTFFISFWTILSILSFPLIIAIQSFGSVIYVGLTIVYAVSCIMYIGGSD